MHCEFVYDLKQCIFTNVPTETLYEKKQSTVIYDADVTNIQAQVEKLESASPEKDAEYEAKAKKSNDEVMCDGNPQSGIKFAKMY